MGDVRRPECEFRKRHKRAPGGRSSPRNWPRVFAITFSAACPSICCPIALCRLHRFRARLRGKVDRHALCALDEAAPIAGRYVAPRTELEETVTELWRGLLGVERIGVEDNFFELGGHSLLATQLVAQISEAYGVDLPLRELFVRPTPAGLAVTIEEALMREIEDLTEDEAARLVAS